MPTPHTRRPHLVVALAFAALLAATSLALPAAAQPVTTIPATSTPFREQLPILYVHGFADDGKNWALNGETKDATGTAADYFDRLEILETGQTGLPHFVVQFWAPGGDPFATGAEGWAVIRTGTEIRTPGQNYNSPNPIDYALENLHKLRPLPDCQFVGTELRCNFPQAEFFEELGAHAITNNYNRNGRVEAHAQDLQDLLRAQLGGGGKLSDFRQVNFITHSAGGLDVRAALHLLNESPYPGERERVANAVFTAPPFGGSTAAILEGLVYGGEVTLATFSDPWLQSSVGDLTVTELLFALNNSFVRHPDANVLLDRLIRMASLQLAALGIDVFTPLDLKIRELPADPASATIVAELVNVIRGAVTPIFGYPGVPKSQLDLTPWGAVDNLNRWKPNYHTPQFVTWGEGGGKINLTQNLTAAQAAYDTLGACCNTFLDPASLTRLGDDWAVSNVSSRVLATPLGGMRELASYPELWHGDVVEAVDVVAFDWARTLVTPATELQIAGSHRALSEAERYYLVGGTAQFTLRANARTLRDRNDRTHQSTAASIEYRVVTFPVGQDPVYGDWVTVANDFTGSFSDLLAAHDLSGERPFRFDWRAVTPIGSKEAIRSAFFVIDAEPPSVVSIEVFSPGQPNSPEILGSGVRHMERTALRSSFTNTFTFNPNLAALVGGPETNWIVRNPADKLLRIDFDEPQAILRFQWDGFFTNPTVDTLPNTTKAFLLEELSPGLHTLYFETRDLVGNASNVVQSLTVLVDDQPPAAALNYERSPGLGFVVGPETPLEFVAEDVETNRVTGTLSVPGLPEGSIPVNSSVQLGETSLAEAGAAAGMAGNFVTLTANVQDGVGNTLTQPFTVYYDYTAPTLDLVHVGEAVLTSSGIYRTTASQVRVEVRVTENAGYHPPTWSTSRPGDEAFRSGGPLLFESAGGRAAANGGLVPLLDGQNVIVLTSEDLVGNVGTLTIVVEKVEELIAGDSARPVELLSRRTGSQSPGTGQGPSGVALSDDGSAFVFASARRDHVPNDTNDEADIFLWRGSAVSRINVPVTGEQAVGGPSRNPALSGNGRYAYFASEATNLTGEVTSGVNLYVKDLETGEVALVSRGANGQPANMNSAFGRLSFLRVSPTYTGRYVFFDDRFSGYVAGDTNGNSDIWVADLDPDADGNFFNTAYVIRRVSVAPDGSEGVGGGNTLGSRYPSVSRDGLFVAFETSHTNLFANDTNGQTDAVLARFGGVGADGTVDFSSVTIVPLTVDGNGTLSSWGGRHPTIDRTGRTATFVTAGNLLATDTNQEGVDSDVYSSTGFLEDWTTRLVRLESDGETGATATGRIQANHAPTLSDFVPGTPLRVAYLADKAGLLDGDNNGQVDLFVQHEDTLEAINWLAPDLPTTLPVLEGGISPNGEWAWWVTAEEYSTVTGAGTGLDLYRRRIDPDTARTAPVILAQPAGRTVFLGESVAFSVQAAARPAPVYQWLRDGAEIPGATNAVLLLASATFEDEGAYSVRVTNEAGTVESASAHLTVTSLTPVLVQEPEPLEVQAGETIVLTASAAGLEPLTYRWQRNGVALEEGERTSGTTSDTLRIADARLEDTGLYRLVVSNPGGSETSGEVQVTVRSTTEAEGQGALPTTYALQQNYPNPFNPTTIIQYALPQAGQVRLEVYNVVGQRVAVLADEHQAAGWYAVTFDARGLASGLYFYRITSGDFSDTKKLMLMR